MKVAIVKYNAGNIRSVSNALVRLGVDPIVTDQPDTLLTADRVIFPGVGEASTAMKYLRERDLGTAISALSCPVLAVCLGMQLLSATSDENDVECLGILPYRVRRFLEPDLKVPHVGWNTITDLSSPLFADIAENSRVYFVHSYLVEKCEHTTATTQYGSEFSTALRHNNFYAVQFHPERSGPVGGQIVENFLKI